MKKLIILQTVVPDYRIKVFSFIHKRLGKSFTLYGGSDYFEDSVKTPAGIGFLEVVKNHFYLGRRILIQSGMWRECINSQVLVLEMNPRILSNWILLILRRFTNNKTVLWGHSWPRLGKFSYTSRIRNLMRNLGDEIIVYTDSQKFELEEELGGKKIHAAPNALYSAEEMRPMTTIQGEILDIIYVGRLTNQKKPFLALKAFSKALEVIPVNTNLIIVGEGKERRILESYILQNNLESRVKLMGNCSEYNLLKKLYAGSLLSLSPGYVGLSITQSLGFGVPMLISRNENHSPEIEAGIEGENIIFFETDDLDDLSTRLIEFFNKKEFWLKRREKISRKCRNRYSIEEMAKPFIDLAQK